MVVKNKGGGGGVVMLRGLKQKKPDGHNIGMAVSTGVVLA
ncbi:MAG: ABC transporter substrate-binding protein, partial [Rhodospirillaceae bacterium]|nr:ABC transporter substrate-binding protein [Rhodospirillaceae bacterium]